MKWRSAGTLVVAVVALAVVRAWFVPTYSGDQIRTLAAGRSFLEGRGFSEFWSNTYDLATRDKPPFLYSGPLTAVTFGLVNKVTRLPSRTFAIVSVAGVLLFFCGMLLLSWRLFPEGGRPFTLWWAALGLLAPLFLARPDEALAAGLFFSGLAALISSADRDEDDRSSPIAAGAMAGILIGACAWVRYAYWPLVVVVPLAAAWSERRGRSDVRSAMVAAVMVSIVSLVAVAAVNMGRAHRATFLDDYVLVRGFFWEQLFSAVPFPAVALGISATSSLLETMLGTRTIRFLDMAASFAILIVAGGLTGALWRRRSGWNVSLPWRLFATTGIAAAAATIAMLTFLSVRYRFPIPSIAEARYYIPIFPFLIAWVVFLLLRWPAPRTVLLIMALVLLPGFVGRMAALVSPPFDEVAHYREEPGLRALLSSVPRNSIRVFLDASDNAVDSWEQYFRSMIAMDEQFYVVRLKNVDLKRPLLSWERVDLVVITERGRIPDLVGLPAILTSPQARLLESTKSIDIYFVPGFMSQ